MQTVGEVLRTEREKKGLTIRDIETATSIRSLYIKAIEDDNYQVIPGEVYLKGFIRNYASFLNLDIQAIMDIYRQSINPPAPAAQPEEPAPPVSPVAKTSNWSVCRPAVLLAVIIAAGALGWLFASSGTAPEQPNPSTYTEPAGPGNQPLNTTPANDSQLVKDNPYGTNKPVTAPLVLTAKYSGECWTSVIIDGKEAFEGTPRVGETITWQGQKSIKIVVGNAGAVDFEYNGTPQGKVGKNGEVVTKQYSPPSR